jgi:hypothetical protein
VESVELFPRSCRSLETRNIYEISFQKYMDFMGDNDLFCQNNPRLVEAKIIEFIMSLRNEGVNHMLPY